MGAENQTKGRDSRRPKRQAPPCAPPTPHPPRRPGTSPPPQYLFGWYCKRRKRSNAGVPGAKPPAKLTYSLPLPAGKGVGGMGERKHTEGKVSRRQKRQAPPADSETAKSAGDKKGKPPLRTANTPRPPHRRGQAPPLGAWFAPLLRCPVRLSPGDARGGAPCMR